MQHILLPTSFALIFVLITGTVEGNVTGCGAEAETDPLCVLEAFEHHIDSQEAIRAHAFWGTGGTLEAALCSPGLRASSQYVAGQLSAGIPNLSRKAEVKKQTYLRGGPLPKRRSFWITEFGYSLRFNVATKVRQVTYQSYGYQWVGAETYTPAKRYFTWEVGHMRTMGYASALGAALFFGTDANDVLRFGVKPRYRRRLDRKISLDIAPGILIRGRDPLESTFPGVTTHVGLNFEDKYVLYGQMEVNRTEKYGTDVAWYGGVKLGSSPGLIAGAVYGLIKVIGSMDFGVDTGGGGSLGGCGG
jgi:hypothetical protein